jgi:galactokinase
VRRHRAAWGEPDLVVRAPGRVNLIGDHTDHQEGFTLPMALPFDTVVALSSGGDARGGPLTVASGEFGDVVLDPGTDPRQAPVWARHVAGVVKVLADYLVPAAGWRATIETDIPIGAGVSSSAALEVALVTALLRRAGQTWEPIRVARVGQRVEHEVVGVPCGIMDQFISAGAVGGHAGLMDCRADTLTPAPLPPGVAVALLDTGTRRSLAAAAYADRRNACDRAAATLGVRALRDATPELVATLADPTDLRRARHVVMENLRTQAAAAAMAAGDSSRLGALMTESHRSLRDDFEVSGPALDEIVAAALAAPGCLGARMTGGGFAGCAVALVAESEVEHFTAAVSEAYDVGGHRAEIWICRPAPGAAALGRAVWPR